MNAQLEAIAWIRTRDLPRVDRRNKLGFHTFQAQDSPGMGGKPFAPVLFYAASEEFPVVSGRFFPHMKHAHWWSLQGKPYANKDVKWWAEMPVGPNGKHKEKTPSRNRRRTVPSPERMARAASNSR